MNEHRISWNVFPLRRNATARTKWDVLVERRAFLADELARMDREIDGLAGTTCGLTCAGCGELLETEKDFAAHFVIPDERFLNLGSCPNR